MNDCPRAEIRDLLPDWVHGALAPAVRRAVAEHLAGCPACAAEAELLRAARAVMNRAPAVDVKRIAAAVRRDAVRGQSVGPPRRWRHSAPRVAALAAAALGVALLTGEFASRIVDQPRPGNYADEPGEKRRTRREPPPLAEELQMGGGIGDLADHELRALLDRLEGVEPLPPDNPEPLLSGLGDEAT